MDFSRAGFAACFADGRESRNRPDAILRDERMGLERPENVVIRFPSPNPCPAIVAPIPDSEKSPFRHLKGPCAREEPHDDRQASWSHAGQTTARYAHLARDSVQTAAAKVTGSYARRLWFLYEWLTGQRLNLPDATRGDYVPAVNPEQQWAIPGENSARHRVRNNLPGTPKFCPLVRRTEALEEFVSLDLAERARMVVAAVPGDLLARTAAFLLLKDSKSSYAIEGVRPPHNRIQRLGRAIGEAGRQPIDLNELLRLQNIVIDDDRFVRLGLRIDDGFVGEHDRDTDSPFPYHISARHEDLALLIEGMVAFDRGPATTLDPVIAAAALAFGFVYVHPFDDGNGRIHRYLIHHVLAQRGFNPPGVVFPVSAAILDRVDAYGAVLEDYSRRLFPLIEWEPTERGNVRVLNDTADFYRFFDATPHAEFLFGCVRTTIEEDLPNEAEFLRRYDQFTGHLQAIVDMPDRTADILFRFLHQNGGRLSRREREREFEALTDEETKGIERLYDEVFGPPPEFRRSSPSSTANPRS